MRAFLSAAAVLAGALVAPYAVAQQPAPAAPAPAAASASTTAPAAPGAATAQAPTSTSYDYSTYEREAIDTQVSAEGSTVDPAPEGKLIERVDIVTLEVIEPRDPAPAFLNHFHATSRRSVIEREVLLRAGEPYVGVLADETARNLRQLPQLSLIAVVAVKGSAPDRVRLLVLTKDVWSLRLSWDAQYTTGGLAHLVLQPTETNLFGARYVVPRVGGSHVQFSADANVLVNRHSGEAEGTLGTLSVGQPLWNTRSEWGWATTATWRSEITRRYVNAHVGVYDVVTTPQVPGLPYEYRSRVYTGDAAVVRSFGWAQKQDVTLGFQASYRAYRTGDLSAYDPRVVQSFVSTQLPTDDTRIGPYLEGRAYTTSFLRLLDVETLGLQEDFRLGHDVRARVYPVSASLGSTRSFFGVDASAQYTVALGDGFVRANVRSITESETDRLADASLSAAARIVSPRLGIGRLVFDASVLNRYKNYLNRMSFLGGDTGLRGYATSYLVGRDVVTNNLEFRTRALPIKTVLVGGAAFYDVGGAFDGFDRLRMYQAVGGGLRVLFPQLDRLVFRIDLGIPVGSGARDAGVAAYQYFFAFGQAFSVPSTSP